MVLASLRTPRSGVYVIQNVCESDENLDAARLQRPWQAVAAAHPALRTQIHIGANGDLRQAPGSGDAERRELDWTHVDAAGARCPTHSPRG